MLRTSLALSLTEPDGGSATACEGIAVDAPGAARLALDRKTSHPVGPVAADIGPLAIGNFNEAMRGYGWDRQASFTAKRVP